MQELLPELGPVHEGRVVDGKVSQLAQILRYIDSGVFLHSFVKALNVCIENRRRGAFRLYEATKLSRVHTQLLHANTAFQKVMNKLTSKARAYKRGGVNFHGNSRAKQNGRLIRYTESALEWTQTAC